MLFRSHRHLREHSKLAAESGLTSIVCVNGMLLDLTKDTPKIAEYIDTGRMYLDGTVQIGALDGIVRDRIRMAVNGHVIVTVILDEDDEMLGEPWCETLGLSEMGRSNASLIDALEEDLSQYIGRAGAATMVDDDKLEQGIKKTARQTCLNEIGKKPEVTVIISRLM